MLKHVQISPLRNRSDSLSLRSSTSCASSICGSPEPPNDMLRTPSRASSYSSLNESLPQTTIKVFTNCLRIDIEYKTLGIQWDTTSKEVIAQLLRRLKMRHRDPRLFYLSMEVTVRRAGVKTILVLDDEARPAILQACHPKGDSRFCLQLKPGGLIRVHTSALQSTSQYKSLVISQETTSDELLCILLSCYNSMEPVEQFSLYEVCPGQEYQRKLHPDDIPLRAQNERIQRGETCHFLVRRNPNYPKRRQLLSALTSATSSTSSSPNTPSVLMNSRKSTTVIEEIIENNDDKKSACDNANKYNSNQNDHNNNENFKHSNINLTVSNTATTSEVKNLQPSENQQHNVEESQKLMKINETTISSNRSENDSSSDDSDNKHNNQDDFHYSRRNTITSLTIFTTPSSSSQAFSSPSSPKFTSTFSLQQQEFPNLSNVYKSEANDITSSSSCSFELDTLTKANLKLQRQYNNTDLQQQQQQKKLSKVCQRCQNSFKSCEFCNKNSTAMILNSSSPKSLSSSSNRTSNNLLDTILKQPKINSNHHHQLTNLQLNSYSPVYNIREIRTVSHSFSSFGNDKKILDIDNGKHLIPLAPATTSTAIQVAPTSKTKAIPSSSTASDCNRETNPQTIITTLKVPINSSVNIKTSSSSKFSNKNPSSILTLIPFSIKSPQSPFSKVSHSGLLTKKNNNNCNKIRSEIKNSVNDLNDNRMIINEKLIPTTTATASCNILLSTQSNAVQKDKNSTTTVSIEEVNNDPSKGLGHFVYI